MRVRTSKRCKIPGLDQVFHRTFQSLEQVPCIVNLQVGRDGGKEHGVMILHPVWSTGSFLLKGDVFNYPSSEYLENHCHTSSLNTSWYQGLESCLAIGGGIWGHCRSPEALRLIKLPQAYLCHTVMTSVVLFFIHCQKHKLYKRERV